MADPAVSLLRAHSRHAPWNARGLAAHATAIADAAGLRPTNASARAAPTARAVRFYISNGLMDRPHGLGTAATYDYRHLLQLLAIKLWQRQGQSLEWIRKELAGTTGDALERKIAGAIAPSLAGTGAGAAADESVHEWKRVPVADGVEIHVRGDVDASRDDAVLAMREAVRAALGREDLRG